MNRVFLQRDGIEQIIDLDGGRSSSDRYAELLRAGYSEVKRDEVKTDAEIDIDAIVAAKLAEAQADMDAIIADKVAAALAAASKPAGDSKPDDKKDGKPEGAKQSGK